jgi:CheY-like chemotaxis protein
MSISKSVEGHLPYLRRYARALTGSQTSGDAYVHATLEAVLVDETLRSSLKDGRVALYRAFSAIWTRMREDALESAKSSQASVHESATQERLGKMTPVNRQALLLTTLEDFSISDAARILGLDAQQVEALIQETIAEIEAETATQVLVIEDEPLIAMQLEELVKRLGHEVCGTAATRTQARDIASKTSPGMVLADIQLADGSSGLDAVDDILADSEVPVIFITAFPERLLTGERSEPTYLIPKPFDEATVRAAISQALFFQSGQPVA